MDDYLVDHEIPFYVTHRKSQENNSSESLKQCTKIPNTLEWKGIQLCTSSGHVKNNQLLCMFTCFCAHKYNDLCFL